VLIAFSSTTTQIGNEEATRGSGGSSVSRHTLPQKVLNLRIWVAQIEWAITAWKGANVLIEHNCQRATEVGTETDIESIHLFRESASGML
jgi:hypothetical protein